METSLGDILGCIVELPREATTLSGGGCNSLEVDSNRVPIQMAVGPYRRQEQWALLAWPQSVGAFGAQTGGNESK